MTPFTGTFAGVVRPADARGTPGLRARQENSCDVSTDQVRREGTGGHRQRAVARLPGAELDQAQSLLHPEVVRQAAEEVVGEDQAPARVAARDRLALPRLRPRGAEGDPRGE